MVYCSTIVRAWYIGLIVSELTAYYFSCTQVRK
nr:MAG TPA: hypothetical protein [Caudoviricetes sp.]